MTFEEADAAYPYDANAERYPERLNGLEKIRAFQKAEMRRAVFELQVNVAKREQATRERMAGKQEAIPWDQKPRRECVAPPEDESDRRFP